MGLSCWLIGIIAVITVVGIPRGKACFLIGSFSFFPCGKEAINRKTVKRQEEIGRQSPWPNRQNGMIYLCRIMVGNGSSAVVHRMIYHNHQNPVWQTALNAGGTIIMSCWQKRYRQ